MNSALHLVGWFHLLPSIAHTCGVESWAHSDSMAMAA